MKSIPTERFGMTYPKLAGKRLCDGRMHSIKAIEVKKVLMEATVDMDFYLLSYHDISIDPQKNEVFYTFLRKTNNNYTKITLLDNFSVEDQINSGKIKLAPNDLSESFLDTVVIKCEEPIKDIETLLGLPYIVKHEEKDETLDSRRHVTILCDENMNLTLVETLEDGMKSYTYDLGTTLFDYLNDQSIEITWQFINYTTPTEEQIFMVIEYYKSLKEEEHISNKSVSPSNEQDSESTTVALYKDLNGNVYSGVVFKNNRMIDTDNLGLLLSEEEIAKLKERGSVLYYCFDENGTLYVDGISLDQIFYELLFIDHDGDIYRHTPLILAEENRINIECLPAPLSQADLYHFLKHANIYWAKFDSQGAIEYCGISSTVVEELLSRYEEEEPTQKVKYELLFIGPDDKVYKNVAFDQGKIDITLLGEPLSDIELYSYMKYGKINWAKFDFLGNITDAQTEDIQPVVDHLETIYGTSTNDFHQI